MTVPSQLCLLCCSHGVLVCSCPLKTVNLTCLHEMPLQTCIHNSANTYLSPHLRLHVLAPMNMAIGISLYQTFGVAVYFISWGHNCVTTPQGHTPYRPGHGAATGSCCWPWPHNPYTNEDGACVSPSVGGGGSSPTGTSPAVSAEIKLPT